MESLSYFRNYEKARNDKTGFVRFGDGGLPAGAIVGIALGSAAAIAAVIVIVLVIKKRKTI